MKKDFSRIIAFVLSMVMLLCALPLTIFASELPSDKSMTLSVASKTAVPGDEVKIVLDLKNNPGLTSLKFDVAYDSNVLTLQAVEFNPAFGSYVAAAELYNNPLSITMISPLEEMHAEGQFAVLTFVVAKNAPDNYVADINVHFDQNDIYDENERPVGLTVVNGNIRIYHGLPGDIDGDSKVNTKDAILLFRYVAGWNVEVDSVALDVNGDNKVTTKDAVALFRYVAGWGDIELYRGNVCKHVLIHSAAKDVTCTEDGQIEFWYCEACGRIYSDEACNNQIERNETTILSSGHNAVIDEAIPATQTSTGLTQGSHCDICQEVLVKQDVIPMISGTNYSISYDLFVSDTYLASVGVVNNNPTSYVSEIGAQLEDLESPGYIFRGWKTSDGTQVSEIAPGTTGNKKLYAQWEKVEYTITFDSPDVPVESIKYTIDTGATLISPSWYGYTFVGWSNNDGFIVSRIKEGTIGNITLHANWTSNRNRATSYSDYGAPVIIEDDKTGQFLFVYNIGRIDNVPLYQIGYIGNYQKLDMTVNFEYTETITSEQAETIANSISNATTRSSGWTLSEDWNQIYFEEEENQDLQIKSEERTDSEGNTVGGNYFVSNSSSGSTYVSNESGGSHSSSSKVTRDQSVGINQSYDKTKDTYADAKVSVQNTTEVEAGISLPVKVAKVSAGVKNTTTVGAEAASGRKTHEAEHADGHVSTYVGTVNTSDSSSYYNTVENNSNSWGSEEGYEKSQEVSVNSQIANAISSEILKKTSYNLTEALGGQNSKTASVNEEELERNEYQSSVKYSAGSSEKKSWSKKYTADAEGYYRLVMAGTVHVYGVVGYDVATGSYYTYSFSVLDDERHEYLDYSKDNANFNDCENGVVSFEIPYEVNEYIVGVTGRTEGLEVNLDGTITGFDAPEGFDGVVSIPQYYSVNNGDNTYSAYQTKAISANAFRGNTEIKTVILPLYITEIPANAFEGCTNLESVVAYGVTHIGDNAFKGCTSLKAFSIDNIVESIGTTAFAGCAEISAMAKNEEVAKAILNSGAKRITLDLTKMTDSFDGEKIVISDSTEYFALFGGGKTFTNLSIKSDAAETFISNMKLVGNVDTPLEFASATVKLARVTVENAPGFAIIMKAANTQVKLYGEIILSSKSENTVISKNVTFGKLDAGVAGYLKVTGKYYLCGSAVNDGMLTASKGVQQIDEATFNNMLTSSTVTFNANGGSVSETSKTVYYNQAFGALPTPTRANYNFAGWYTAASGGTQITAETFVTALANQTLYAHWTPKTFTVTYDANGGSVSPSSKTLTFGDALGTLPTPTRANYNFAGWRLSDGTAVNASSKPGTAANFTIYANWTPKTFTLTYDAKGGSVSPGSKTLTFGDSLGTLPTPTKANYDFAGWKLSNGTAVSASTVPSSATNLTVYASWTPKKFTLTYNANGGTVSPGTKTLTFGDTLGTLPTPKRDYHNFLGWYDANGNAVSASTKPGSAANLTITARWEQKAAVWVKASEIPSGAQVVDRKWTYTKTETTESTNASMSGWTKINETWRETGSGSINYASFPTGYDTANKYYKEFAKAPYEGYDNGSTKRVVTNSRDGWIYWHWMYNVAYAQGTNRAISNVKGTFNGRAYIYFYAIKSTVNCPAVDKDYCYDKGIMGYNCHSILPKSTSTKDGMGTSRFFRFECNLSSYVDYEKVYTYQKVTNNLESKTAMSNGGDISNVQEWVYCRSK